MEDMYQYLKSYLDDDFIASLKREMEKPFPYKGMVINLRRCPLKTLQEEFKTLEPITNDFCLYDVCKDYPGRNPLLDGGAYYILDPASYKAVTCLGENHSNLILDMCASPGGKTITCALNNPDSLIIANDISASRAAELARNVERIGLNNVIVTSLDPAEFLKMGFKGLFQQIILDAPCSGSGMFRKEEKMEEDWSYQKALHLLPVQDSLLETGYQLLAPGGEMMYSTCSFLKEEDEDRVEGILANHSDLSLIQIKDEDGCTPGAIKSTYHLFPNVFKGEGQFFSLLKKEGESLFHFPINKKEKYREDLGLFTVSLKGEEYGINHIFPPFLLLPFYRFGIKLTDHSKYAKIELDHSLSHYVINKPSLDVSYQEAEKYLRGEEMKKTVPFKEGPILISYKGVCLGYGLYKGGRIRNMLPKGLRINSL